MSQMMDQDNAVAQSRLRVRVFVDFWNFTLELKARNGAFRPDWSKIGPLLTQHAAALVDASSIPVYDGLHVYGSFDPNKPQDTKLKSWFCNTLDRMPGVHATLLERQRKKGFPRCPHCHAEASNCVVCFGDMRGTEERAWIRESSRI